MKKYIFWALGAGFIFLGFSAYLQSLPESKNDRIYKEIKKYSPYYLDKRFGGLLILNKEDKEFKEKPTNMEVFHVLDKLEKAWGKSHIKLSGSNLIISDNNGTTKATIVIQNEDEMNFVRQFYGI
ncbi:hypothetical protein MNB_SV-6-159 [hydrothermal vent metagenome]|uniref:Uncharacterized protein n=1 Tax=hydrothermal vent metagenome TaxID=652676 RepID=A0A1W1BFT7_9ZZZZ